MQMTGGTSTWPSILTGSLVNLPVDTFYYDMEEAISNMAKFGINRTELRQ